MFTSVVFTAVLASAAADDKPPAAWDDLFPALANYKLTLQPPVVEKGDAPTVYRQTGRYDWINNDLRAAVLTLARDPEFKTKYSAEAFKKEKATEVTVGNRTAWMREPRMEGKEEIRELVIPLGEDKAVIVEGRFHIRDDDMKTLAGKLDLAAVEKALEKAPATSRRTR